MKKYKLIKEYPGWTCLGEEAIECPYNRGYYKAHGFYVPARTVENFPEFWQEVVEKTYEVLSFMCGGDSVFARREDQEFKLQPNGRYEWSNVEYTYEMLISHVAYKIWSIKRLSDGEVFTIGDNVACTNVDINFSIENIIFKGDIISLRSKLIGVDLERAYKYKKLIFTTEDGVEIFDENTVVYMVGSSMYNSMNIMARNYLNVRSNTDKVFSTRELADNYIIENKPCLSLKDMRECFNLVKGPNTRIQRVQELVKEKLKL